MSDEPLPPDEATAEAAEPTPSGAGATSPTPPRSFGRRAARFAVITGGVSLGIVGLVLVSVGGGVFWLTTESGNRFLRDQVVAQAAPFFPGATFELKTVDTNLFEHLVLGGVAIRAPDGHAMVEAREVRLRFDLSHVLDKRVDIAEVALVEPNLDLQVLPTGDLDLVAALGPSEPAPPETGPPAPWVDVPADIRVARLAIEGAALRYRDATVPDAPLDVVVSGLDVSTAVSVAGRRASLSGVHIGLQQVGGLGLDLPLPLSVDGGITYDESKLQIEQLQVLARRSRIVLAGQVDQVDFDDRVLGLQLVSVDLDEADIEALAADDVLLGGLSLTGAINGPLSDLSATLDATTPGGGAHVSAWVDTTAVPLAWRVGVETPSLDVDRVTPLVAEPTHLNLEVQAEGVGTDPNTDLRATFGVTARDQVVFNELLPELRVGGRMADGVVHLEEFGAVHGAASVSARGSIDLVHERVVLEHLDAKVPSLTALSKYGAKGLQGRLGYVGSLRVDGFGEGGVLTAEGNLDLTGFGAEDAVRVQAIRGPVNAHVALDTQAVKASGRTTLTGVDTAGASIGSLALGWEASVQGAVVTASTSIDLAALSVGDGAVQIDRIATREGQRFRGGVDRRGEPWAVGALNMTAMKFGSAGYEAQGGQITLGFRNPDGNAGSDTKRLEVGFDLDRNGEASFFEGRVQGDLVSGEWQIDDLVIAPMDDNPLVADGPVRFKLVDGGARDIEARLRSDAGSLTALGSWVPDSEDASTLDLVVDKVNLEHVARLAQLFVAPEKEGDPAILEGLKGIASLSVRLQDAPGKDLVVDATADLDGIGYPNTVEQLFLDAEVHGPITLPQVKAQLQGADNSLLLALGGKAPLVLVEGAPQLDCARNIELDAIVAPGNIQRFSTTLPVAGELPDVTASAALLVDGPACDPNLSLVSSASVPVGKNGERVRLDLDVHRNEGQLRVDGAVEQGLRRWASIEGAATTNLSKLFTWAFAGGPEPAVDQLSTYASAIDLSIVPLGIPIQSFRPFVELPRGLVGRISGGLNISGRPESPIVAGGLLWTEGAIGEVKIDQAAFMLLPNDGGYSLDGDLAFSTGGTLALDGFVPIVVDLDSGGDIDLERPGFTIELSGDGVPLEILDGVVDGISDAGGRITLTGKVGGTVAAPDPTFEVAIKDGHMLVQDTGLYYKDLTLDSELTRSQFTLRNLSVVAEPWNPSMGLAQDGPLFVSGKVEFADGFVPSRTNLHVKADSFWLIKTPEMQLKVDSKINIKGDNPKLAVRGNVAIIEGLMVLGEDAFLPVSDLSLDPLLVVHRRDEEYSQGISRTEAENSPINDIDLALDIDMTRAVRLKVDVPMDSSMGSVGTSLSTASVDLEVSSQKLDVALQNGEPSIAGVVEMGRGDLDFFGKTFDIGGGSLTFAGKSFDDPQLELQAVLHTGRYGDVGVGISGSVSDPKPQFTSDDYPDQTDIISIILFGKPASELGDNEGQTGGSQLGAALAMAAGSSVSKALGSSFGGQVEFDQDALKVGIPLSDKSFLSLERHANAEDDENVFAVALELLISRQMYAEMVTGDRGQSSADLYMRWRF